MYIFFFQCFVTVIFVSESQENSVVTMFSTKTNGSEIETNYESGEYNLTNAMERSDLTLHSSILRPSSRINQNLMTKLDNEEDEDDGEVVRRFIVGNRNDTAEYLRNENEQNKSKHRANKTPSVTIGGVGVGLPTVSANRVVTSVSEGRIKGKCDFHISTNSLMSEHNHCCAGFSPMSAGASPRSTPTCKQRIHRNSCQIF